MEVVDRVPLLCLDLLVIDEQDRVLLGWRENSPAKDSWFVPGGSVMKGEGIEQAFARIAEGELGLRPDFSVTRFRGVHQHHFARGENFAGDAAISTHCIVLAYELQMDSDAEIVGDDQHGTLRWFSSEEVVEAENVHPFTKDYFRRPDDLDLGQPPR